MKGADGRKPEETKAGIMFRLKKLHIPLRQDWPEYLIRQMYPKHANCIDTHTKIQQLIN